ncbi:hypothetical protein Q5M85_15565 [Paraclostridium bifermentans]|nr:hypothetical protein [Paraclostridium bifermentans]
MYLYKKLIKSDDIKNMGEFLKENNNVDLKEKTTLYKSVGMGVV